MSRYSQLPVSHMAESLSRKLDSLEREVSLLRKDVRLILHLLQQKAEDPNRDGSEE